MFDMSCSNHSTINTSNDYCVVPVIGFSLALCSLVTRRVGVALPVIWQGAPVSCTGPAADGQRAVRSWEGQAQTGKVAGAPLKGLDAFEAVRSVRHLVAGPVTPVLGLCNPHAALC